jgi:N-acetylneuraminic acid mutarotase
VLTNGCPNGSPGCPLGFTRRLYSYDPRTDTWARLKDCPNAHSYAVGGVIGGKFYVAGGDQYDEARSVDKVDVYDPVTNTWAPRAPTPTKRRNAGGAVLGRKLYLIGGVDETANNVLNTVEAYAPDTDTWETKASLPTTRFGVAAGAIKNAEGVLQLLALGGGDSGTFGILATNEAYTR